MARKPSPPRAMNDNGLSDEEKRQNREEARRMKGLGAEVITDPAGRIIRARRIDVFQLLLERRAIPQEDFNAVREYQGDIATAGGFNTPERRPDHIQASCEGAPGQNIGQVQIEASHRTAWVERMLTTRDFRLLTALLHENDANCGRWRGTVEGITGEKTDTGLATAVRCLAANLKDVRDRCPPRKRAA